MRYYSSSILPDNSELSPDVEWMLQSGQVPAEVLAAELVRVHFPDLAHWLTLVLDDPDLAVYTGLEACLAAALNAYRFPGGVSSQVWVFQQAARLVRRILRPLGFHSLREGVTSLLGSQPAGGSLPATTFKQLPGWRSII